MLGPFATASRRHIAIHQLSLHAACASMSTTTTTTRDRGDRYGPMGPITSRKNYRIFLLQLSNELCRKNANTAVHDRDGLLALHHAVIRNNLHIVELLLSYAAALTVRQ